ncbi:MAG TPA: type VI secretion system protein TssA [Longimicrobium sp.]|nr:type VI secretion system protein TssA [Longimicrobium sp.]
MTASALHAAPPHVAAPELALRIAAAPAAAPGGGGDVHRHILEALRADDDSVPFGIWERPLKRANPQRAAELAVEALLAGSGDLQVAGWLVQAWVMMHGFSGARAGLDLVHALCHGAWAGRHEADAEGEAQRRAFAWMAAHLPGALARAPITHPAGGGPAFTWEEWEAAQYRDRVQRAAGERPEPGKPTPDDVRGSATRTPTAFYRQGVGELDGTLHAVRRLQALLRERWPASPPSLEPLHRAAAAIRGWLHAELQGRPDAQDEPGPAHPEPDAHPAVPSAAPHPAGPPIRGRDEAYAHLAAAADYLARTEPHSPVPWLVRRAVEWGEMELAELLGTLIGEGYDLKTLRSLLGLADGGRP